jgi:hypothetical protein
VEAIIPLQVAPLSTVLLRPPHHPPPTRRPLVRPRVSQFVTMRRSLRLLLAAAALLLGAAAEQPVSEVALVLSAPDTPIPLDGLAVHLEYARCAASPSTCIKLCAPALPRPRIHYTPSHTPKREGGYGDKGDSAFNMGVGPPNVTYGSSTQYSYESGASVGRLGCFLSVRVACTILCVEGLVFPSER